MKKIKLILQVRHKTTEIQQKPTFKTYFKIFLKLEQLSEMLKYTLQANGSPQVPYQ